MRASQNDFQEQLMRGLAHRMNNILSLFHGYLSLLMEDKKLDPVTRQGLAKIKDGALAASDLMDRTAALVRPTSAVWRDVHLPDLLRQLQPTLETFCDPHVHISIEASDQLPRIWADPSRVRQAVIELVKNACQAARTQVHIAVTAESSRVQGELFTNEAESPEHWLTIAVSDDGPGIPIEHAERIYQPFYTTKTKHNAAGLGLAVVLACTQQLGGKLRHRSRPGETVFELTLPSRVAADCELVASS
jgi:signal transduction histidine kinase